MNERGRSRPEARPRIWFADRELVDHSVRDPWENLGGDEAAKTAQEEYDSTPELRDLLARAAASSSVIRSGVNERANKTHVSKGEAFRRMNDRIDALVTDPLIADDLRSYEAERQNADRLAAIKPPAEHRSVPHPET
ncbi:hypothetical protein [Mycobacterium sp. 29Ha]|uniref:hypothetical protein n=1 Tax=Mycobacterium sp. 29Ha TaxID=2939268 RepID=UPI0029392712|nr:hypothetical protein [Mycobacterium sp. 29Ha]MDV3131364.1 hypothetical protein [Mycobacterium sp. 29Ha]